MSGLVKLARARVSDKPMTHWEGCEREHKDCLIQRMADAIERLTADVAASASQVKYAMRVTKELEDRARKAEAELTKAKEVVEMVDDLCDLLGIANKEEWFGCYQKVAEVKAERDALKADNLKMSGIIQAQLVNLVAANQRTEKAEAERDALVKYKAFVDWMELYGATITIVADERGSKRLDWYRGVCFGNTMDELMSEVERVISEGGK